MPLQGTPRTWPAVLTLLLVFRVPPSVFRFARLSCRLGTWLDAQGDQLKPPRSWHGVQMCDDSRSSWNGWRGHIQLWTYLIRNDEIGESFRSSMEQLRSSCDTTTRKSLSPIHCELTTCRLLPESPYSVAERRSKWYVNCEQSANVLHNPRDQVWSTTTSSTAFHSHISVDCSMILRIRVE